MGWKSAGPGADEVKRGQGSSPGQEEDHEQCPGSCTHPEPQGSLQSCPVESGYRKDFQFLHICISIPGLQLRDFRGRRPSLFPSPSPVPCFPFSGKDPHGDPSDLTKIPASGFGMVLLRSVFPRVAHSLSQQWSVAGSLCAMALISLLYSMSDWRSQVSRYAWVSLGIAMSIRPFLVTRERKNQRNKSKILPQ